MNPSADLPGRRRVLAAGVAAGLGLAWPARAVLAANASQTASGAQEALNVRTVLLPAVPAVPVVSMQGDARQLDRELATREPLVLNFIFTTCSTSCSMQTAQLVELQRELASRGQKLALASLSIDPENDTPAQLRRFAQGFQIGAGWQFYTGRYDDLLRVQRHFDVYRGSKAAHPPVLLMRRAAGAPWLRVEGFPATPQLVALARTLPVAA